MRGRTKNKPNDRIGELMLGAKVLGLLDKVKKDIAYLS